MYISRYVNEGFSTRDALKPWGSTGKLYMLVLNNKSHRSTRWRQNRSTYVKWWPLFLWQVPEIAWLIWEWMGWWMPKQLSRLAFYGKRPHGHWLHNCVENATNAEVITCVDPVFPTGSLIWHSVYFQDRGQAHPGSSDLFLASGDGRPVTHTASGMFREAEPSDPSTAPIGEMSTGGEATSNCTGYSMTLSWTWPVFAIVEFWHATGTYLLAFKKIHMYQTSGYFFDFKI